MAITLFILWLLPLTFLPLIFFVTKIKDLKLKLPPNPPKLPIIGNLHQLRDRELPHRSLCKLSNKYGPVMLLRYGSVPVVILSSSQAAEQVLKTHDLECSNRPKLFASQKFSRNYQDIGLTSYSKEWRERRNLVVRELFSLKKVRSFMDIREKDCNLLVKKLSESASKQCPVNLSKTLFVLVASMVFRVVFRQDFHESKFIDKERFEEVVLEAQTVQARLTWVDFFPGGLGWFIDRITGQHKRLEKVFVEIDTFLQKVIDDHTNPLIISRGFSQ